MVFTSFLYESTMSTTSKVITIKKEREDKVTTGNNLNSLPQIGINVKVEKNDSEVKDIKPIIKVEKEVSDEVRKTSDPVPEKNVNEDLKRKRILSEGEASSGFETVSSVDFTDGMDGLDLNSEFEDEDYNLIVKIANELAYAQSGGQTGRTYPPKKRRRKRAKKIEDTPQQNKNENNSTDLDQRQKMSSEDEDFGDEKKSSSQGGNQKRDSHPQERPFNARRNEYFRSGCGRSNENIRSGTSRSQDVSDRNIRPRSPGSKDRNTDRWNDSFDKSNTRSPISNSSNIWKRLDNMTSPVQVNSRSRYQVFKPTKTPFLVELGRKLKEAGQQQHSKDTNSEQMEIQVPETPSNIPEPLQKPQMPETPKGINPSLNPPLLDSQIPTSQIPAPQFPACQIPPPHIPPPQLPPTNIPPPQIPPTNIPPPNIPPPNIPAPQIPPPNIPPPNIPPPQIPPPNIPPPQIPPPNIPAPQIPAPQIPTSQIPVPQIPSPQIPSPQIPSPQIAASQIPSPQISAPSNFYSIQFPQFPSKSVENLPLVPGPTGLPVHVTITGEQILHDMDGKRIPLGPNGYYLPLDPTGRLFPHIVSPGNQAVPIHMTEDGVLRLPNAEPVPVGPGHKFPVNTDGSIIVIGADSKPLHPCSNLPREPPIHLLQMVNTESAGRAVTQALTPQLGYFQMNAYFSGTFSQPTTSVTSPVEKGVNEKRGSNNSDGKNSQETNDDVKCVEVKYNVNNNPVKKEKMQTTCQKQIVKSNGYHSDSDMILDSGDSDIDQKPKKVIPEEILVTSSDEEVLLDKILVKNTGTSVKQVGMTRRELIIKRVQKTIKSLLEKKYAPPAAGRFIISKLSNTILNKSPNESPLWRNRIKLAFLNPNWKSCPSKEQSITEEDDTPEFKFLPNKNHEAKENRLASQKSDKSTLVKFPVFTFDFAMQCDFTSDVIKDLNAKITKLEEECNWLKNCNTNLLNDYKNIETVKQKQTDDLKKAIQEVQSLRGLFEQWD